MAPIFKTIAVTAALCVSSLASEVQYSEYILAPSQRILKPVKVRFSNGTVSNAAGLTTAGSGETVMKKHSAITFDYTKNIGGLASFTVSSVNGTDNFIGISFTESSLWISPNGCDGTQNVGIDQALWFKIDDPGVYTVSTDNQRGGFRYLNVYHNSSGSVGLKSLNTNFTAMPTYAGNALRDYTGYFHSDHEGLNRAWYASAYTDQLCTIPSDKGNSLVDLDASDPTIPTYWWANSTMTNGSSALVDGAKRDKLIWPGDFSISLPGVFLSTNDQETLKLSVTQLFSEQNNVTGQFPYAASPIYVNPPDSSVAGISSIYSFTYHMYNMLALNNYYTYSGDMEVLRNNWNRFQLGLNYTLYSVDSTGLAYVPTNATADWLRLGMGAYNIEANSILAFTLQTAISLANTLGDTAMVPRWQQYYDNIVTAANEQLWNEETGLFNDNTTTTLNPQDGNSWAIISGVANCSRATSISNALHARWGKYGAPAPEAGTTVSPFISGFELQAHYLAGHPVYAEELMKLEYVDFMLDDPRMTNSTYIEGYDVSGALHYPAYSDDARISHAHGWSTGPLIALSNYAAGLHVINSKTWVVNPRPGNLKTIDAGFTTAIGAFSATWTAQSNGGSTYVFSTPEGTTGTLILQSPTCKASVKVTGNGKTLSRITQSYTGSSCGGFSYWGPRETPGASNGRVMFENLPGGKYTVQIKCQ